MDLFQVLSCHLPSLFLSQRHSKLPVSLQDVQIKNLHSQSARWDQRSFRSFLHPSLPEGERVSPHEESLLYNSWFLLRGSFSFCLGHFLYRVIWSTGTSRGKCGTICLERKCLRFRVCLIFLSFVSFLNHIVWSHCLLISSDLTIPLLFWVQVDFADTSVVITEPYFNFSSIQESMNEILFEEYQFQSALRINGESMLDKHGVGPRFLLLLLSFTANSY